MVAQVLVAPDDRDRLAFRLPGLDLVGDGPERAGVKPVKLVLIGQEFGRILDVGASGDILAPVFALGGHRLLRGSRGVSANYASQNFR